MAKPCSGCGVEHRWGSCSGKPARFPMLRRLAERLRERGWAKLAERQERLWSLDCDTGTLTPVEPDVEARARAGSF
ncbi:hypothetical protein LCGC14_0693210 [marine sediment metagenome]|uniref:Uncharacterized protein n=1 Tax=marine sediment metagenome TaxID=412755 RepID=A0A0F9QK06_9ZZZZ